MLAGEAWGPARTRGLWGDTVVSSELGVTISLLVVLLLT